MKNFWNANDYTQFLDERTRPARDLLSAIPPSFDPKTVIDLGCGPGNSTIILKQRWQDAQVMGIDSSEDMLQTARKTYSDITFQQGDINQFLHGKKFDCIFSNAAIQWCDHHAGLLNTFSQSLMARGFLAVQIPNNFHLPAHQAIIQVLNENTNWTPILKKLRFGALSQPFYQPLHYYDFLQTAGFVHIQLWETDYYHEMTSHAGIFEWLKGTGLKPVLSQLDADNQRLFENKFLAQIQDKFPLQQNQTILFPFKRIFMVGMKP